MYDESIDENSDDDDNDSGGRNGSGNALALFLIGVILGLFVTISGLQQTFMKYNKRRRRERHGMKNSFSISTSGTKSRSNLSVNAGMSLLKNQRGGVMDKSPRKNSFKPVMQSFDEERLSDEA